MSTALFGYTVQMWKFTVLFVTNYLEFYVNKYFTFWRRNYFFFNFSTPCI